MAGNRKYGKRSKRRKRGGRKTTNVVFSVGNSTADESTTALRYEQPEKRISYSDLPVNLTDEQKGLVTCWFTNYGEDEGLLGGDDAREKKFLVNVDGYLKENEKAGYGVIIWDSLKMMPITVYSEYNKHQISAFYHDLQGVNKGLELAIERKLLRVSMRCKTPEVAEYVRSPCRGGSQVHVCLKCFKKHHYKEANDKTYLLMLDTAGLLQAFYRQKGRPVFDIEAVDEASNKSAAAYIAQHGNGKGKMKQGEIFENKELLLLLVEEAYTIQQQASVGSSSKLSEDELEHHHGCDNHVCPTCTRKDFGMKEEQDSNDNCVQLKQLKTSIDLRDDLTAKEKEFVKSWFRNIVGGSMDDAVQAWIMDSVKNEGKVLLHVGGYSKVNQKSGYGVMIRDSILCRPITAYSHWYQDSAEISSRPTISNWYQDSAFYLEMQGINKGLELAIELELGYVSMRCTSTEVARFVRWHWDSANFSCCCGSDSVVVVCLKCLKNRYDNQLGEDDDRTFLLLLDTISLLQAFRWQENYIFISIHGVEADNKSAAYIAEHRNGMGKMKLKEILDDGKLLKLLFKEAVIEWA